MILRRFYSISEPLEQENLVTYLDEDIKNFLIKCREAWLAED